MIELNQFYNNSEESLKQVLTAFQNAMPQIGYVQGMNYIVAILMTYLDNENCFWILISLMKNYKLKKQFQNLANIKKNLFVFDCLVQKYFPTISKNLKIANLESIMFASGWFISLFTTDLPFGMMVRIFDIYFFEPEKILYRIALAIVKLRLEKLNLAGSSFEKLMYAFKNLDQDPAFDDPDRVIKIALSFKFSRKYLQQLNEKYHELNPSIQNKKNKVEQQNSIDSSSSYQESPIQTEISLSEKKQYSQSINIPSSLNLKNTQFQYNQNQILTEQQQQQQLLKQNENSLDLGFIRSQEDKLVVINEFKIDKI